MQSLLFFCKEGNGPGKRFNSSRAAQVVSVFHFVRADNVIGSGTGAPFAGTTFPLPAGSRFQQAGEVWCFFSFGRFLALGNEFCCHFSAGLVNVRVGWGRGRAFVAILQKGV